MTVEEKIEYLLSIKSVRETNAITKELLLADKLNNFDVDMTQLDTILNYVIDTIHMKFPTKESFLEIPVHGRYQHFEVGGVARLTDLINTKFKSLSDYEICKKLIDLFIVSVLLDAGAGNEWEYDEDGAKIGRSEGIAVATFHMFLNGDFSSHPEKDKYVINGEKLISLAAETFAKGFQHTKGNEISGFEGRLTLLNKLGKTLVENKLIFGEDGRPGNLIDYLISYKSTKLDDGSYEVDLQDLWMTLMKGLTSIWPVEGRIKVYGTTIGDAWILKSKADIAKDESDSVVTFHKLTQWLTYSLFLPLTKYGHFKLKNVDYMTGLPEYRNGGLFVDFKLLNIKPEILETGLAKSKEVGTDPKVPSYVPDDDLIIEWRSCIIVLLDYILPLINEKLEVKGTKYELALPQLIEAGSWSSGRRIAKELRDNGGPPIELIADGTVF